MIFTIERMVSLDKYPVKVPADGRTAVTRDEALPAQWEQLVGATETGPNPLAPGAVRAARFRGMRQRQNNMARAAKATTVQPIRLATTRANTSGPGGSLSD